MSSIQSPEKGVCNHMSGRRVLVSETVLGTYPRHTTHARSHSQPQHSREICQVRSEARQKREGGTAMLHHARRRVVSRFDGAVRRRGPQTADHSWCTFQEVGTFAVNPGVGVFQLCLGTVHSYIGSIEKSAATICAKSVPVWRSISEATTSCSSVVRVCAGEERRARQAALHCHMACIVAKNFCVTYMST